MKFLPDQKTGWTVLAKSLGRLIYHFGMHSHHSPAEVQEGADSNSWFYFGVNYCLTELLSSKTSDTFVSIVSIDTIVYMDSEILQ